jgi:hypothetical protein
MHRTAVSECGVEAAPNLLLAISFSGPEASRKYRPELTTADRLRTREVDGLFPERVQCDYRHDRSLSGKRIAHSSAASA